RVDIVFATDLCLLESTLNREQHSNARLVIVGAGHSAHPEALCSISSTSVEADLKTLELLLQYEEVSGRRRHQLRAISWGLPALFLLASIVIWQVATKQFDIPVYVLPSPTQIARALFQDRSIFVYDTLVTMRESIGGFLV